MNKEIVISNDQGMPQELHGLKALASRAHSWIKRLSWKFPRLVWRGDEVWVNVKITNAGLGGTQTSFAAEDEIRKLGISFDTGAGCGGRDWEWDWSLKGPIKITFRGKA